MKSAQNRSTAVMNRRVEPHDSLEDFPTPPWAGRALFTHVVPRPAGVRSLWEPACNRGYLARGLADFIEPGGVLHCTDIFDYGFVGMNERADFLMPGMAGDFRPDWIVTNPPFRLAQDFVERALDLANVGVAVLVRSNWVEGVKRYNELFSIRRPYCIAQFVERVAMVQGRCDPRASTATAYSWVVWYRLRWDEDTRFVWIPPCRKELERPGDYDLPPRRAGFEL